MSKIMTPLEKNNFTQTRHQWLNRWSQSLLHQQLSQLQEGEVILHGSETRHYGKPHADFPVAVQIEVNDDGFYPDTVFGGSIGAAESYMAGFWRCSSLVDLVRVLLRNSDVLNEMDGGRFSWITQHSRRIIHALHRNTETGSRRNIAAHYDLGNDFFRLFLDDTMMYSSAFFEQPEQSLYEASLAKLDLICRKLQLGPDDHVLEIGSGWGGFAIHAASRFGCRVTTTTISRQQFELAGERIRAAGLESRITLLLEDYRNMSGTYDKLVSIEMIEAVGHQFYDTYFAKCASLLKPDGLALIQAITIADQNFKRARDEVDFIKRYIFPGSCIPAITPLMESATRASDLTLIHLEDIGPHYALTLRKWRENFMANLDKVKEQGYSEHFIRMWEFYLCYCEGGYLERSIGDAQMLFGKPRYHVTL